MAQLFSLGFIALMDKLITGLILAAISGITFLAYKHPKAYDKLFQPLMFSSLGLFIALSSYWLGWSAGHTSTDHDAFPFSFVWIYVGYAASYIYFKFLAMLPQILEDKPKKKDEPHDEA